MAQQLVANTTYSIGDWLRSRCKELPKQQSGLLIRLTAQYQMLHEYKDDLKDLKDLLPKAKGNSTIVALDIQGNILELEAKIEAATKHRNRLMFKILEYKINPVVFDQWISLVEQLYPIK